MLSRSPECRAVVGEAFFFHIDLLHSLEPGPTLLLIVLGRQEFETQYDKEPGGAGFEANLLQYKFIKITSDRFRVQLLTLGLAGARPNLTIVRYNREG